MTLNKNGGQGRRDISVFVSCDGRDASEAQRLCQALKAALRPDRVFNFTLCRSDQILAGEPWDAKIKDLMSRCPLGLPLISNHFLSSKYITQVELPALLAPGKHVIPVCLSRPSPYADWHGLDALQVYGFQRPFSELRASERPQCANELAGQFHRIADRYFRFEH